MSARARRLHRVLALSVAGGLAISSVLAAAGPAAAVPVAEGDAVSTIDFDNDGGAPTCSAVTGDKSTVLPFSSDTAAKTVTNTSSTTVTDSADTSDVTKMTGRSSTTAKLTAAGGSLRSIDVNTSLRATYSAAQGFTTSCDTSATVLGGVESAFKVAKPGWLTVTATKGKGGQAILAVGNMSGIFQTHTIRIRTIDSYRFYLPAAGDYLLQAQVQVVAATPGDPVDQTEEATTFKVHGEFRPAGAATGSPVGAGKHYLRLGAARLCAGNSLKTTFTPKAGKAKSAQLYVNGKRRAKVAFPKAGRVLTLKNLPGAKPVTVRAVIVPKQGKPVSVSRSYLACS
ncbi:MAG: hypothetical protein Q8O61_12195 [Nocardioides sp.]|nr:hypothetical protein [Nocardioides sp.]